MLLSGDESWPTSSCMLAPAPAATEAAKRKGSPLLFPLCSGRWKTKTTKGRKKKQPPDGDSERTPHWDGYSFTAAVAEPSYESQ